ncbi:MAG: hypothetical protein ACPF9D_08185 [Owenweeksia sp.]
MKEENPIDELFRKQLENRELKPSDAVWAKIESGVSRKKQGRKGHYWMRAAVVTLLMGVSSWVYFTQNESVLIKVQTNPEKNVVQEQSPETKKQQPGQRSADPQKEQPGEKKSQEKSEPAKREIVPIMRNSKIREHHFVQEQIPTETNEELLAVNDNFELESVDLKVEDTKKQQPPIKLKYMVPVTQKSFYADQGENEVKKPKLKERVFAYANDQFSNILNGEPVELPKSESKGKPQLEINLGKLFNN